MWGLQELHDVLLGDGRGIVVTNQFLGQWCVRCMVVSKIFSWRTVGCIGCMRWNRLYCWIAGLLYLRLAVYASWRWWRLPIRWMMWRLGRVSVFSSTIRLWLLLSRRWTFCGDSLWRRVTVSTRLVLGLGWGLKVVWCKVAISVPILSLFGSSDR